MTEILLAGVLGYLLGAVPTGVLICRALRTSDVRQHGSGHTGGLNVTRVGGIWAGTLTVAADVLLGVAAVAGTMLVTDSIWATAVAGAMAVVGHNWSVFIRFGGGIGLSTLGGTLIYLSPERTLVTVGVLVLAWFLLTRPLGVHPARTTIFTMFAVGPVLWASGIPSHGVLMGVMGAIVVILKTLPDWHRQYR